MFKGRTLLHCSSLPKGWVREEVTRQSGASAGKRDVYYHSPDGIKFRSKLELVNYLGDSWDLTEFNFRLGKTLLRAHKGKRKTQKSSIEKHRTGMEPLSSSAGMEESWPNVKKENQAGEKLASVVDLTEEEPSSPSSAPSLKYTFDSERSLLKVNRDNVSMSESDQVLAISNEELDV
uniref:MBD domain-containing protein n=1 Tax=Timema bartmani TaxID=61472 RepID=A0A7R9I411_9NEOP|nr:unnamed protein product [Timema bartmani]